MQELWLHLERKTEIMKKKPIDLEEELGVTTPDLDQLKTLEEMVNKALLLTKQIEDMQATMTAWNIDLYKITWQLIPDAMSAAGVNKFTTKDGFKVEIEDFIRGSLPKDDEAKRKAAIEWLMENGGADIVKGQIIVPFAKGDHNYKEEIKANLKGMKADFLENEDVHPMTLKAFAREKIRRAEEIPLELLGLFAGRKAEIIKPKEDKKQ